MTAQDGSAPARPRRVLLVAFHFPPLAGSSGIHRSLSLARELPALGWEPIVLTADARAYERTSDDLLREVPPALRVVRSFALDTARHLTVFGRYPRFLARPDRWASWYWSAVPAGLRLVDRLQPELIWSTYPIATAHSIAAELHRRTGLPWIADFRDPMAQEGYPADPKTWQAFKAIEEIAAATAARLVFVTPGAMGLYVARYPNVPREGFTVIENGYDEALFQSAEQLAGERAPLSPGRVTLLHSGIVYPSERDPTALFTALARLKQRRVITAENFRLLFRAPAHDELLHRLAVQTGTAALIEVKPPISYREALAEMMRAEGLVVMQAANCNEQIPAKLYEYLRARRPIVGLADPAGDTARAMRGAGAFPIGKLEDADRVEATLEEFLESLHAGRAALPDERAVAAASRRSRIREYVELFNIVAA